MTLKNKEKLSLKKEIADILQKNGFTLFDNISFENTNGIANKFYKTAAGEKELQTYLTKYEQDCYTLEFNYYSEGRNILESTPLQVDINDKQLGEKIINHLSIIEQKIDKSYARKIKMKN